MPIETAPLPTLGPEEIRWFWTQVVDVRGPEECWDVRPGIGSRDKDGYVRIWLPGHGRSVLAHRLALALDGRDPGDGLGLHSCDRTSCAAPHCLYIGDAARNAADRDLRGRRRPGKGADSPVARLTWREAEALRRAKEAGVTAEVLAQAFQISRSSVFAITSGKAYQRQQVA